MNRYNGTNLTESEHLRQSITDILLTPIGTRIQRREYGSAIPVLLDSPISGVLMLKLAAAGVQALHRWEPRVQVTRFKPTYTPEQGISADIVCRTKNTATELKFNNVLLGAAA